MSTFTLGSLSVHRVGFGAMQLPGPGVMGPQRDREEALAVMRRAVKLGVDHVDTAQFYGPDVANELIRDGLGGVRRVPLDQALEEVGTYDFMGRYVDDLPSVVDVEAIREAGIRIGADAVVGAGSAVVADVADGAVVGGAPARALSRA